MHRNRTLFLIVSLVSASVLILLALVSPPAVPGPLGTVMAVLGAIILLHAAYRAGRPFPLILIALFLWFLADLIVRYSAGHIVSFTAIVVINLALNFAAVVCLAAAVVLWFRHGLEKYK